MTLEPIAALTADEVLEAVAKWLGYEDAEAYNAAWTTPGGFEDIARRLKKARV